MSHPFNAGDAVVCIDNEVYQVGSRAKELRLGHIYRVDAALWDEFGQAGVTLCAVDHTPAQGWHAFRFKHLGRGTKDFEALLRPCRQPTPRKRSKALETA